MGPRIKGMCEAERPDPSLQNHSGPSPEADLKGDLGIVPLFPLPNVVLFPHAILPLHIFEERYKAMTRHALEGDRRIAMALLRPGWEKQYHDRPAIEPIVCVGTILTHEELPDGRFNFLLQGTARARVRCEVKSECYRLARVQALEEVRVDEEELWAERERIAELFASGPLAAAPLGCQFRKLIGSGITTPDLADLIAFNILDDVPLKQSLLAEPDMRRRIARTLCALEETRPVILSAGVRAFRNAGVN